MSDANPMPPQPLHPGDKPSLHITDIAFGGEGVGRIGDFVVFVPFVANGEHVQVEIVEVRRSFARARLLQVIAPSPDRTRPVCAVFGQCGGCQYQHLQYPAQLAIKTKQTRDLLQRVGHFASATVDPVVPCPQPFGYRNRIMLRSQWNKLTQSLVIGFLRHDSGLVVDVRECPIAEPAVSQQIAGVHARPPHKGGIKVVLRLPPEDWVVPPDSFFQNNFQLLPALAQTVRSRLQESQLPHFIDAYCGVGFFALEVAPVIQSFVGIEYDHQAVLAARQNARQRSITNGEFLQGTVEDLLPGALARFDPNRTALLLDPPRRGAHKSALDFIRAQRPAQILYVSCHPATLARDLDLLCRDELYQLLRVTPLDMFPQTQHVECVADLRLRRQPPGHDQPHVKGTASPEAGTGLGTHETSPPREAPAGSPLPPALP